MSGNIADLTGDVSASGPGSVPATVNLSTASAIVRRDANGNFIAKNALANNITPNASTFGARSVGYGVVAPDIRAVFPETISESEMQVEGTLPGEERVLHFHQDPIFWALVNAVKELKQSYGGGVARLESLEDTKAKKHA